MLVLLKLYFVQYMCLLAFYYHDYFKLVFTANYNLKLYFVNNEYSYAKQIFIKKKIYFLAFHNVLISLKED